MAASHPHGKKITTGAVIRVYWSQLKKYKLLVFFTALSVVVAEVIGELLAPLWYRKFVDQLTIVGSGARQAAYSAILSILILVFVARFINWLMYRISDFLVQRGTTRVMSQLECHALHYLLGHSYKFFTDTFAGSLVRRVNRLSRSFDSLYDTFIFQIIPLIVTVGGIVVVLCLRYPVIGFVVLGFILLFAVINYVIALWKLKYDERRSEKDSESTGTLSDIIANSLNVKLFSGLATEDERFGQVSDELRKLRQLTWNIAGVNFGLQWLFMIVIEGVVLVFALKLWSQGSITVGDFVLFQAYLGSIFNNLRNFGRMVRNIYENIADAKEMVEILETPHDIRDLRNAKELHVKSGRIDFKNVIFTYQKKRRILDRFSLTIDPGEKIAVVGPSGAGKSTVIKLLLRFFDLDGGTIAIDGQDISKVTQDSLRSAVSLVPQEPVLFHRTLMENIRYGRRDATDEEVILAAQQAHCGEFIGNLPQGYETFVGERGIKLSGGERQRVAIARAILRNAPILVLDEATSSLDSESESLIQDALRKLMRGKTVIVIAHRLSTIMQMDRIVVMEDGRVADSGTHSELLHKAGIYKKLWNIQSGGYA